MDIEAKLKEALDHFIDSLKTIRTGRANAAMLDSVTVETYGSNMPLKQVANVVAVDAQLLQVTPFDPNNLNAISEAIRNNASLGLNPSDDGRTIRLIIPSLTEERRREIAKQINEHSEECFVRMRNIRHEAINQIDAQKKSKDIGEDEAKRQHKQVEDLMTIYKKKVDDSAKAKEAEILKL